jgi:hypothetical protein
MARPDSEALDQQVLERKRLSSVSKLNLDLLFGYHESFVSHSVSQGSNSICIFGAENLIDPLFNGIFHKLL